MAYRILLVSLLALITFFSVMVSVNVLAEDDQVYIYQYGDVDGEYLEEETNTIYMGDRNVCLRIKFGTNCVEYIVEMYETTLFNNEPSGTNTDFMTAGTLLDYGLFLNPEAPAGEYQIYVCLNYTDEAGEKFSKMYDFILKYIEAIRFKDHYIDYYNERFHAVFESHVFFEQIIITLGTSREIHLKREAFFNDDVDPEIIQISSKIEKNQLMKETEQTITYSVKAINRTHIVELVYSREPIRIDLSNQTANDTIPNGNNGLVNEYTLVILLILILAVISVVIYLYRIKEPQS